MIELFATDLDGTFLNQTHRMDEKREKCIQTILEKNKYFAISTGRNIEGIQRLDIWDYPVYFILMNGSLIMDDHHNVLYEKRIDPSFCEALVNEFEDVCFEYTTKDEIYVTISKEVAIDNFVIRRTRDGMTKEQIEALLPRYVSQFHFSSSKEEILQLDVIKINAFILKDDLREKCNDFISKFDSVINTPSGYGYIEITDCEGTKANGIRILAKHLGIEEENIATFGDGMNDVSMLGAFSHSYAPKDGGKEALEAAHYIIDVHYKDSVLKKMYELMEVEYE